VWRPRAVSAEPAQSASVETVLEVRSLNRRYGAERVVEDVSFKVRRGEVFTLLGPSGCGKSTTLRLVAGLERPDSGEIFIQGKLVASAANGVFVSAEHRNLGLVFQSYAIWPHMTVAQNVAYPLELRRIDPGERTRRVDSVLDLVGLAGLGERSATQLSGGQQQRVALARALAYEPDLLLLDEPLSNLDAKLRDDLRLQLQELQKRLGTTILYVTHDQTEAMALSNQVAVMNAGRIEQVGAPRDIYERPATYFVQNFVGRLIAFDALVESRGAEAWLTLSGSGSLRLSALPATGAGTVRATIRPEDVTFAREPNSAALRARLETVVYCGDHFQCLLAVGPARFMLEAPKSFAEQSGTDVLLDIDPAKLSLWPL